MKRRGFFGAVAAALGVAACAVAAPMVSSAASARVQLGRLRDYGNLRDIFLVTAPSTDWKPRSYRVMVITETRLESREIVLHQHLRSVRDFAPCAFLCLHTMRAGETFVSASIEPVSSSDFYTSIPAIEWDEGEGPYKVTRA